MYRKKDVQQTVENFILPFDGTLSADNRWVVKAQLIPWDDIEGDYSDLFPSDTGNVAKPARGVFGSLVIKETLGLTPMKKPSNRSGKTFICNTFLASKNLSMRSLLAHRLWCASANASAKSG